MCFDPVNTCPGSNRLLRCSFSRTMACILNVIQRIKFKRTEPILNSLPLARQFFFFAKKNNVDLFFFIGKVMIYIIDDAGRLHVFLFFFFFSAQNQIYRILWRLFLLKSNLNFSKAFALLVNFV